ncbi:MAG: SRPBCC family protein [Planctomycetes bacterium]|nr:SRPBCC family protein [Planctomycetota bacterium]NUQ35263.1 SRPBCC family protein [Planctomycetaceae bacterium]
MSGLLKRLFLMFVIFAVLVAGVGLLLPSSWQVERSIVINAEPAAVHQLVDDLRQWPRWTPWTTQVDPTLKITYGQTTSGAGASQTWTAEHHGNGTLKILTSDPASGITYRLSMNGGEFESDGAIRYEKTPEGTKVTWSASGENGYDILKRYAGALFIEDAMGPDFEQGLSNLKKAVEPPQPSAAP